MQKKIYFISDFHLGVGARVSSAQREREIVRFLSSIAERAEAIYLMGDIFEFWFEYSTVVPKGFVRFLGKIAELRDQGIPIFLFTGNHDMWIFDYFEKELNIPTYRQPMIIDLFGKKCFIGHGDGLGPGDHGYKLLKKIFANPLCQWLFERLHPNFGIKLASFWSQKSRDSKYLKRRDWLGGKNEWLVSFCEEKLLQVPDIQYFVFGHRHLPIDYTLSNQSAKYINSGDWLNYNSYVSFDGEKMEIHFFETEPIHFEYKD
jgi:UDP-2,3-diacylglucosamine hydrolase